MLPYRHFSRHPKLLKVHEKVHFPIAAAHSASQASISLGHSLLKQICCPKVMLRIKARTINARKDLIVLIDQILLQILPIISQCQNHDFYWSYMLQSLSAIFKFFDNINIFMSQGIFTCVNCQLNFDLDTAYKEHYKSEHHRYNVKRKLIGLSPLSQQDYYIQFQSQLSSKSQSNSEIYCQVCSKKFMSPQTYKQHINSSKHKQSRKALLQNKDKSESSSLSEFQLIDEKKVSQICPFCPQICSQDHLKKLHSFPPFSEQCTNVQGLIDLISQTVKKGQCIYCSSQFGSKDSAKQHMTDCGHAKLDLENFHHYEQFYIWKINQSSEEDQFEAELSQGKEGTGEFKILQPPTLAELEEKRQGRIKYGIAGVTINGKEVGYRAYRQYYKQFLNREIKPAARQTQKAIDYEQWKNSKYLKVKPQFQKITANNNHR